MKKTDKKYRILELDFFRGLAIIGMIAYHFHYFLDFYGLQAHNMTEGFWHLIAQLVIFSFLLLVGISTTFSKNNIKRAIIILLYAMVVTGISYFAFPDYYIRFGILHLIGVSIILISPLKNLPHIALILGIIAILMPIFLLQYNSEFLPLIILGVNPMNFASFDFFPIFPWVGISLIGIFLGNKIYKDKKTRLPNKIFIKKIPSVICIFGQNALIVYVIQFPIMLLFIFIALKIIDLSFF